MFTAPKGQSLLEIVIALGLFMIGAMVAGTLLVTQFTSSKTHSDIIRATQLAEDGLESARAIRNRSWYALTVGDHGLTVQNNLISFSGASDTNGPFTRTVTISLIDTNTKQITSTVTWQPSPLRPNHISLTSYATKWRGLGQDPLSGDWTEPVVVANTNLNTDSGGTGVAVRNHIAYLTTSGGAGVKDFFVIDATNPTAPVVLGSLDTNSRGLDDVAIYGDYAYVASRSTDIQLQIINIANPANPFLVATHHVTGSTKNAYTVAVDFPYAYIGTGKESNQLSVYSIDVSDPSDPKTAGHLPKIKDSGDVMDIVVKDGLLYLANTFTKTYGEFIVADVSDPLNPTVKGSYDLSGFEQGWGVSVNDNGIAVVVRQKENSDSDPEFVTLDVSDPAHPVYLGGVNVNQDFHKVLQVSNLAFASLDKFAPQQLHIYDIANPAAPSFYGSLALPDIAEGLAFEDNLLYVAVRSASKPLAIITSTEL